MQKPVTVSIVVRAGTDSLPELRVIEVGPTNVVLAVDGRPQRMGWRLLGAWAGLEPGESVATTPDVRAAYLSVYRAADRVRSGHTSEVEARRGRITDLVREGRRARDLGDVVREGEIARTLDGLLGRWMDGRWVGGQAAILGEWQVDDEPTLTAEAPQA